MLLKKTPLTRIHQIPHLRAADSGVADHPAHQRSPVWGVLLLEVVVVAAAASSPNPMIFLTAELVVAVAEAVAFGSPNPMLPQSAS